MSLDWSPKTSQFRDGPFGTPREGEGAIYVLGLHGAMIESYVQRWNGRGPYLRELLRSVRSLKLNSPRTRVSLITDEPNIPPDIKAYFEHVIVHKPDVKVGWGHKIPGLLKTPYAKTLFLDADTVICWPLDDMFVHLNHTQVGVVIEPGLYTEHLQSTMHSTRTFWYMPWVLGHQLNSGMLLYRADPAVLNMYNAWHREFSQKEGIYGGKAQTDQAFLAHILDATRSVKYIYLPPEYNMRVHANTFPHLLRRPVYMLHSRYAECGVVNERIGPRLYDFRKNTTVYWYAADADAAKRVMAGSGSEYRLRSYCACDAPQASLEPHVLRACGMETDHVGPSSIFTMAQFAHVNQTSMYVDDDAAL